MSRKEIRARFQPLVNLTASVNDHIARITLPKYLIIFLLVLTLIIPFVKAVISVFSGSIAFWFDPARDLFLASGNLSKLTLIGPPSGIPGVFYGPYWIWLLSTGMLISKDPRIVTFVTATVPYFIIFPILLYQFRKIYSVKILSIIWLLFIFTYDRYATQLWNPYVAPLLFLAVIYLLTFTDLTRHTRTKYLKMGLLGILTGLSINFHISFGIALTGGIFLYITTIMILSMKGEVIRRAVLLQYFLTLIVFGIGFSLVFVPFLAFEIRHGFNQIKTAIATLSNPYATVGIVGLADQSILEYFFGKLADVFRLPRLLVALGGVLAFWQVLKFLKKEQYSLKNPEVRLLLLLTTITISLLHFYLSSKNPVWDYHFINVEIIFLLILAFLMKRFRTIANVLLIFAVVTMCVNLVAFSTNFSDNMIKLNSLATKEHIVTTVTTDGKNQKYTVFAFNPAIYNYDYAYLFDLEGVAVPYDPGNNPTDAQIVYLIIPKSSQEELRDYISYRTPLAAYQTTRTWKIEDGSTIIKREKK